MPPAADQTLPRSARAYVCGVIAIAAVAAGSALIGWQCDNLARFLTMLVLAAASAAVKARLPGITGTYSGSFIFILAAIPALAAGEMIIIAAATAAVQNLWRATARVRLIQLAFNVSTLVLSTVVAYGLYRIAAAAGAELGMLAAAIAYWALNTGIVSALLTMLGQGTFFQLWKQWCTYSLLFHVCGGAVAILLSAPIQQGDLRAALVFAPVVVFAAKYYRTCVTRAAQ
jgi:hypothetical protein